MTSRSEELRSAALRYAERGWPVLPLKPQGKTPLTKNGLLDAQTNPDFIEAWWTQHPEANIGLRTGVTFDVLDLDGDEGVTSLGEWLATKNIVYRHSGPVSRTGRGYHLLFRPTRQSNRTNLIPKVDFRGENGYIVAPPSLHPTGRLYEWHQPEDRPIPRAPDWLVRLLDPPINIAPKTHKPVQPGADDLLEVLAGPPFNFTGRRRGNKVIGECPFPWHKDDTPSFVVYTHNWTFYCFGCQSWGDSGNLRYFVKNGELRRGG